MIYEVVKTNKTVWCIFIIQDKPSDKGNGNKPSRKRRGGH